MDQEAVGAPSTLADRAGRAIEAMTAGGCSPRTDRYVADLVNDAAERMYADGRLDAPTSVCDGWVRDLRTAGRAGHTHDADEHRRNLAAFSEALGVPAAYLERGDRHVAAALQLITYLRGYIGLVPMAQQVMRLPEDLRNEVFRAVDTAEEADRAAGHVPALTEFAAGAVVVALEDIRGPAPADITGIVGPAAAARPPTC